MPRDQLKHLPRGHRQIHRFLGNNFTIADRIGCCAEPALPLVFMATEPAPKQMPEGAACPKKRSTDRAQDSLLNDPKVALEA